MPIKNSVIDAYSEILNHAYNTVNYPRLKPGACRSGGIEYPRHRPRSAG